MVTLAFLLMLGLQDADRLYIDEVSEAFQKRWAAAEESRNPKELLDLYAVAHDTFADKLAQPDPNVQRWIPLRRMLAAKLAALPQAALEPHEVIARQVLETVLEPATRRKAIAKYAYTQAGREALNLMANVDGDQNRLLMAMRSWSSEFEVLPTAQTAARLALAHAIRNDSVALTTLRAQAEARGLKGEVKVAGQGRELYEYLDSLKEAESKPLLAPASAFPRPRTAPSLPCEYPLGHYEMKEDGRYGSEIASSIPAIGKIGDRELMLITNGLRLIALDPSRAEGGKMDDAVEWKYPKEGPVRTWTLGGYNATSLPYVGPVISGNRAYVTMFSKVSQTRQQVGKRPERFEGPAAIRAFDLTTGELLWDTETLEMPADGEMKLLMDVAPFGHRNFCFGGPPIVRGNRVYAAVMTSPYTERQCWALCLDAETGRLLWCTNVASAPSSKEVSATVSFAEQEGTLVLITNFGVAVALDSTNGTFEWLVKYPNHRTKARSTCSPPIIAGSLVYFLAQDSDELLAYDRWTGLEAALPLLSEKVAWDKTAHLIGQAGDWLVLSGEKNTAIRPQDGRVVQLPDSEPGRLGRGTIVGDRFYLPTRTEVSVFDTLTWKLQQSIKWPETTKPGNLLVTGSLCLHLSDRLDLYTGAEFLKERFGPHVDATPPKPLDCRQLARILENAGKLKESVPYYRRALKGWERDPAWQETAESLKKKLSDLEARLGDDFPKE